MDIKYFECMHNKHREFSISKTIQDTFYVLIVFILFHFKCVFLFFIYSVLCSLMHFVLHYKQGSIQIKCYYMHDRNIMLSFAFTRIHGNRVFSTEGTDD